MGDKIKLHALYIAEGLAPLAPFIPTSSSRKSEQAHGIFPFLEMYPSAYCWNS